MYVSSLAGSRAQLIYDFWYPLYWGYWVRGSCGTSWRELAIVLFEKNIARRSKLVATPQVGSMTRQIKTSQALLSSLYCYKYLSPVSLLPSYCYHIHRQCFFKRPYVIYILRHLFVYIHIYMSKHLIDHWWHAINRIYIIYSKYV
jgi:hypothetical protein